MIPGKYWDITYQLVQARLQGQVSLFTNSYAHLRNIHAWRFCSPEIPAIKEQSHSQKDRGELLEPPSQVYSLQLCRYAAYSFAQAKKTKGDEPGMLKEQHYC